MRRRCLAIGVALTLSLASSPRAHAGMPALPPASPAAVARLERACGALGVDHALAVRYDGQLDYEGHLARPHATESYRSTRRITVAGPDRARQDWSTWQEGDTTRTVESTLLLGGHVLHRDTESSPWVELAGRDAGEAAWVVWSAVPAVLGARGLATSGHGLLGGPISTERSRYQWPDQLGQVTVEFDVVDAPFQMEVTYPDAWRGLLAPDCRYFGTTLAAGHPWPDSLATVAYAPGVSWRLHEHRVAVEEAASLAALVVPDSVHASAAARTDTLPVVTALAPHVWAVDLPDMETRSLVLEFADHLVLLETSSDVPHGERLKSAIEKLSLKPVRYVSFSHHHPDYTGGLRPFVADSAIVVCAPSNTNYVNEMTHWLFAPTPDRLWRLHPGGMTPKFDTLTAAGWHHADATNEVVAIDIGQKSHHTDHYVVFWLPRAKLLFEGDLGYFTVDGKQRASARAAGLLEAIDEAKWAPAKIVQGWAAMDAPRGIATGRLRELVAARAKR